MGHESPNHDAQDGDDDAEERDRSKQLNDFDTQGYDDGQKEEEARAIDAVVVPRVVVDVPENCPLRHHVHLV